MLVSTERPKSQIMLPVYVPRRFLCNRICVPTLSVDEAHNEAAF